MQTRKVRQPIIFQLIDERNIEKLEKHLDRSSSKQEELYELFEDKQAIEHAADSSFWEGVGLFADRVKYNSRNEKAYRNILRKAIQDNKIQAVKSLLAAKTPLVFFENGQWLALLIADINKKFENPLTYAIKHCPGNTMFKTILDGVPDGSKKILLSSCVEAGETPIQAAFNVGKFSLLNIILNHPLYELDADDYLSCIDKVLFNSYQSVAAHLTNFDKELPVLMKKLNEGMKKYIYANARVFKELTISWQSLKNHQHIIRYLFAQGYDLTHCDQDNKTPIEIASREKNEACLKLLIEIDNEINPISHPERIKALHLDQALLSAIKSKHLGIARILLSHHAKLDINMINEVVQAASSADNLNMRDLLLEFDANPLLKIISPHSKNNFYRTILTGLQSIETFIATRLQNKKPGKYEVTSAEQFYQYAKILSDALNQRSEFKYTAHIMDYLRYSYFNLFTVYLRTIEQQHSMMLNNSADRNYQETITQTYCKDTHSGNVSLLKTILYGLIDNLEEKKNLTQTEIKKMQSDFSPLTETNWNLPAAKILEHIREYLHVVRPASISFVEKIRNYFAKLKERINKEPWKSWSYRQWEWKDERPDHIAVNILPKLNKINEYSCDLEVVTLFIDILNTFSSVVKAGAGHRHQATVVFADKEVKEIAKISYKNETLIQQSQVTVVSTVSGGNFTHHQNHDFLYPGYQQLNQPAQVFFPCTNSHTSQVYYPLYTQDRMYTHDAALGTEEQKSTVMPVQNLIFEPPCFQQQPFPQQQFGYAPSQQMQPIFVPCNDSYSMQSCPMLGQFIPLQYGSSQNYYPDCQPIIPMQSYVNNKNNEIKANENKDSEIKDSEIKDSEIKANGNENKNNANSKNKLSPLRALNQFKPFESYHSSNQTQHGNDNVQSLTETIGLSPLK